MQSVGEWFPTMLSSHSSVSPSLLQMGGCATGESQGDIVCRLTSQTTLYKNTGAMYRILGYKVHAENLLGEWLSGKMLIQKLLPQIFWIKNNMYTFSGRW